MPEPAPDARPPQAVVMQMMMAAWAAQAISAVTRLGVPDLIQTHGPLTARQLTADHRVDAKPKFLERTLRACAGAGVFTEDAGGRFGSTPLSETLTVGSPVSVRSFVELIGGRWWPLFGGLVETLRTGREEQPATPFRPDADDPAATERFGQAMRSRILPHVIALAERHAADEAPGVRARLTFVAGDMFAAVPAGDTYLLKTVIHDWDDDRAVRVLRQCRDRAPRDGRVVAIDNVLPPMGDTSCPGTKLLDLLMMVSLPGKERTEAEWRALYDAAGLEVRSITVLNSRSGESILEGVPR